MLAWILLALLATAVSVLRNEKYAVCARRDELSYDAAKLKFSCYAASLSLLFRKKSQDFFRGGEAAKIDRAVVLTAAYKFELASTMAGSVKKAFSRRFFAIKKRRSGAAAIRCKRFKSVSFCKRVVRAR